MSGRVTLALTVLAIAVLVALLSPIHIDAAEPTASFTTTACPMTLPNGLVEGRNVTCGWLTVPENHEQADGRTLRLLVVRVSSLSRTPRQDPIVLAQGGPGGSTIDGFLPRLQVDPFLRQEREVVLFDQRGTLYTDRPLACNEMLELTDRTIEQNLPTEEADRLSVEAAVACRDRLAARGDDLADVNSVQNAHDVEALRTALGFDRINLYGVSYGTLLALHTIRLHPQALRSVILDGVVPPQGNFVAEAPHSHQRALATLFEACRASADCNRDYPDLENVFYSTVDRMNASPARVRMRDADAGKEYNAVAKGDWLISGIIGSLYVSDIIPGIPRMIYDARDGRFEALARIQALLTFDRTMSYGMYFSVVCAESRDFTLADVRLDGLRPQLANEGRRTADSILNTCARWGVPDLGAAVDQPVRSDVPVLLFSGAFDPITPASAAEIAAQTLTNSYSFTFLAGGHGALFGNPCAGTIASSFLEDPNRAPDSSCLAGEGPPRFLTNSNTVFAPGLSRAVLADPSGLTELGVAGGALAILLSGLVLWPAAWLYRALSHRPVTRQLRGARRVGLANALAAGGLFAGLVMGIVGLSSAESTLLLFGLPAEWRPLLFLIPVIIVLTAIGFVLAVRAWQRGAWSVLGRLYFTLHCLAALALIVVLARWDLVTALLPR